MMKNNSRGDHFFWSEIQKKVEERGNATDKSSSFATQVYHTLCRALGMVLALHGVWFGQKKSHLDSTWCV